MPHHGRAATRADPPAPARRRRPPPAPRTVTPAVQAGGHGGVHRTLRTEPRPRRAAVAPRGRRRAARLVPRPRAQVGALADQIVGAHRLVRRRHRRHGRRDVLDPAQRRRRARRASRAGQARRRRVARDHGDLLPGRDPRRRHHPGGVPDDPDHPLPHLPAVRGDVRPRDPRHRRRGRPRSAATATTCGRRATSARRAPRSGTCTTTPTASACRWSATATSGARSTGTTRSRAATSCSPA